MDNKLFAQAIDSLQKGIDTLKEALKPKTEFKIGWIYKDGNGIDFLIEEISDDLKENYYPIRACKPNNSEAWRIYTLDGKYFRQKSNEKDLILESGRPYKKEPNECKFKVGWVYKDGWDVEFIIKKIEDNPDFVFPIYAYLLRKDEDSPLPDLTRSYTLTGQFLSEGKNKGDLILESGRPYKEGYEGFQVGWVYRNTDNCDLFRKWFYVEKIANEGDYPLRGYHLGNNLTNSCKPAGLDLSSGMPKEEWDKKYRDTKDCKLDWLSGYFHNPLFW